MLLCTCREEEIDTPTFLDYPKVNYYIKTDIEQTSLWSIVNFTKNTILQKCSEKYVYHLSEMYQNEALENLKCKWWSKWYHSELSKNIFHPKCI